MTVTANPPPKASPPPAPLNWTWVLVALASHTAWGAYPVLARYLQTVSNLPGMALLAAANALTFLLLFGWLRPHLKRGLLRSPLIWLIVLAVLGRAPTNMLAARFALAIYVQLAALSTPFLVVLLGRTIFREPIPAYTIPALLLSLIGSLLMLSGGNGLALLLPVAVTPSDWLGMALALVSSLFLALYMLLIRRSASSLLAPEAVLGVQLITITSEALLLSLLLGEDWSRWGALAWHDWLVFGMLTCGVFIGANLANIAALRRLGAPFVSSMLGWRLVSTLALAALLLGERLQTPWQVVGALLVLATISWYARHHTLTKKDKTVS